MVPKAEKIINACPGQQSISENESASLERTVVSVENSVELNTSSRCDSLNETPSEPDALEDAEVSCSEADTTASSSFTTSPVALSNLYANSTSAVVRNVDNVNYINQAEFFTAV